MNILHGAKSLIRSLKAKLSLYREIQIQNLNYVEKGCKIPLWIHEDCRLKLPQPIRERYRYTRFNQLEVSCLDTHTPTHTQTHWVFTVVFSFSLQRIGLYHAGTGVGQEPICQSDYRTSRAHSAYTGPLPQLFTQHGPLWWLFQPERATTMAVAVITSHCGDFFVHKRLLSLRLISQYRPLHQWFQPKICPNHQTRVFIILIW